VETSPSVLIVDSSRESREVLRLLLERRGATAIEADRPEEAIRLARDFRPNLIVFDAECDQSRNGQPTNDLRQMAVGNDTPIVILGKVRPPCGPVSADQVVAKPYHYGPLIRKINGLLAAA
jgi:CheY-like chemotaxis protein